MEGIKVVDGYGKPLWAFQNAEGMFALRTENSPPGEFEEWAYAHDWAGLAQALAFGPETPSHVEG